MGDASFSHGQLSEESFRRDTYENTLSSIKDDLAMAGFYYTRTGQKVKCFNCSYEFDAGEINPTVNIVHLHKEASPNCQFAKSLETVPNGPARSKKFLSYDSLRYEKERLETFIDWNISWLSPEDLAKDGFYYLRTKDHCACVFCRGIVGAWEVGDTPRGEHQRHFPHCPFIKGSPVGNVPLNHSTILDKLPLDGEECPLPPSRCEYSIDEAGSGGGGARGGRLMPGSYPECHGPTTKNINFDDIGLRQYSGPKRKDYITKESRIASYKRWPDRVIQKPEEMAEAGFFYCGLSDHVRCFHCGNGLRNWECDDKPWDEHARWYPDCNYVVLSKGQEFIDKVRRERPPYLRSVALKGSKPQKVSASSGQFKPITEKDLDPLMESDIIQAVTGMGFPAATIRKSLRLKLEQTGMPFFSLEPCIEAVLYMMEEETRQTLHGPTEAEDEAMARQSDKMEALNIQSQSLPVSDASTSSSSGTATSPSTSAVTTPSPTASSSGVTSPSVASVVTPSVSTSTSMASSSTSVTNVDTSTTVGTTTVSTSPPSPVGSPSLIAAETAMATNSSQQTQAEAMDVDEVAEDMEMQAQDNHTEPMENIPGTIVAMQEADQRISVADEILKPARSGPPSVEMKGEEGKSGQDALNDQSSNQVKNSGVAATSLTQKDIADELERIRESRSCKICMDAEMDVVFLPCTHMATCSSCAVTMAQCPICRHDIKYTIKPIIS